MKHATTLIIGAGPAGLQMAYFLERQGSDYLVLERNQSAASFFQKHPRHREMISLNKRFNGFPEKDFNMRHDWNSLLTEGDDRLAGEYTQDLYPKADDVVRYFTEFAERHALKIQYGAEVQLVSRREAGGFLVQTRGKGTSTETDVAEYSCDRLLMATGAGHEWLPPDVEGIDLVPSYEDHDINPELYQDKTVLIIGRGNSAFEVANHLAGHAAIIHIAIGNRPIDLAWDTHSVRHLRSINNTILEMFHVKALHGALGLNVRRVTPGQNGGFDVVADEEVPNWQEPGMLELNLHYDHVIRCTGFKYVTPEIFAEDIAPHACMKSKYPLLDSSWQSSTPDLYYLGTAMASRDKVSASGFIHGFRYNVRSMFHLLRHRYEDVPLPSAMHPLSNKEHLSELATNLLQRLSTTAGLYQQFGFLCDVLRFKDGTCEIFQELPKDYVLESKEFTDNSELLLITFEYGFSRYAGTSPLNFITQMDETTSRRCAAFLQPIFRRYKDGVLVEEDNLGDSLTLRYSHHRPTNRGLSVEVDVEHNIVSNIINRIVHVTDEVFTESALLGNHAFKPWPKDRPLDVGRLPRCQAMSPKSEAAE